MSIAGFLQMLSKLGYPTVDSNGNLLAEITPRTDTIANLTQVSDAGNGELATATDTEPAIVLFRGDPTAEYYIMGNHGYKVFEGNFQTTSVPTGASFTDLNYASGDPEIFQTDTEFDGSGAAKYRMELRLTTPGTPPADLTYIQTDLQYDITGTGTWIEWSGMRSVASCYGNSLDNVTYPVSMLIGGGGASGRPVKMRATHDSASSVNIAPKLIIWKMT